MTKTIWKFPLAITDEQTVEMPRFANILRVDMQGDQCCLWALVNPDNQKEGRTLQIYGTGHPIPERPGVYRGTFMTRDLVFHVFERAVGWG